jgi:ABC-type Fe3+/spermidine/putrescine transport system ATPase subunit
MPGLTVQNITKMYGTKPVLDSVSFFASSESITAILGPSGCGKTTLLRVIAGLEDPDHGEIFWNGENYSKIPAHRRGFGLMFQDYALFPHLSVVKNIAFGMQLSKTSALIIQQRVEELLNLLNLTGFGKRDVHTLSGGEAQRVALARTLATQPCMLMLDEPMGSLDRTLRDRLINDLRTILRDLHLTTLYVTHDQEEAFSMADKVIIMKTGRIAQIGAPEEIYQFPADVFVAKFLGMRNLLRVKGQGSYALSSIGQLSLPNPAYGDLTILVRPESMRLDMDGPNIFEGTIIDKIFLGSLCRISVEIKGTTLTFDFQPQAQLPEKYSAIKLSYDPQKAIQILPDD